MIILNLLGIASCTFVVLLLIILVAASIKCMLEAGTWKEVFHFILFAIFFITTIYSINVFIMYPLWVNILT